MRLLPPENDLPGRADDPPDDGFDPEVREHDPLTDAIERRIENATCGRVSALYVARLGGSIVVHGYCRTYHVRDLAHQAARDMTEDAVPLIDLLTVS